MRRPALWVSSCFLVAAVSLRVDASATRQQAPQTPPEKPAASAADEGIPVENETVRLVCGGCHKTDAKGRMSRISQRRTTPEGWQETIRRMVTLNKADIEPDAARQIVKYLADRHGLSPEETKPAAFEVERRLIDFKYAGDAETERVCSSCHSIGRVMLQRRTAKDWEWLLAMHRGWYPLIDFQVFRRGGPASSEPGPDGRPPDSRHPMDRVLAHLRLAYPLVTPEWSAWSATMRSPRLEGTWAVSGYQPGLGPVFGTMTIGKGAGADEFTTSTTLRYPRSGRVVSRTGRAVVYTGHQWRGRTTIGGDESTSEREVMSLDRGWQSMTGRWFAGAYDETGIDVTLARVGRDVYVAGLDVPSLKRSTSGRTVRVFGANLPSTLTPGDLDFGRGVTVSRVVASEPTVVTVQVDVAADAPEGARDLVLAGAVRPAAVVVYDKIDAIKTAPAWNMARVGGVVFPKMLAQFEALAFANGADGKPDTKDDLALGAVDVTWSLEEYTATFDDDDLRFVGEIDATRGLFTPAVDGPNPARSGNRNNVGDVWAVATYAPPGGPALRARAHLVVTVPLYLRWDFSTVQGR